MLAVPLGVVLLIPLGMVFDTMNWPLFHTWALIHGSFIFALPLCCLVVFGLLYLLPWFRVRRSST